jgi:hypothetical protein
MKYLNENYDDWQEEEFDNELNFISKKIVRLNCGLECEYSKYKNTEFLTISLYDLYNGYGKFNDLKTISNLFKELNDKGFKNSGISLDTGYYDSIDDLKLNVNRTL